MDDRVMRQRIDEALDELEQRLRTRRRMRGALGGAAAGLVLAMDACVKIIDGGEPQPLYGVEVDAASLDATADGGGTDLVVLYGVQDAGPADLSSDLNTLYGFQDAGPGDMDLGEMNTLYGFQDAGLAPDADLGEMVVMYGIPEDAGSGDTGAVDEDAAGSSEDAN